MDGFEPLVHAARALAGLKAEWMVTGGWAVDLFLGRSTREHADVDVGVAREDQAAVRELLTGWQYEKVVPNGTRQRPEPWPADEWLSLPVHTARARSSAGEHFDFLLLEQHAGDWAFPRDRRIRLPWPRLSFRSSLGVTALAPEVALLFKARRLGDLDRADFDAVLPHLARERQEWLHQALAVAHPGHPWAGRLAGQVER